MTTIVERTATETLVDGHPIAGARNGPELVASIAMEIEATQRRWRVLHAEERAPRPRLGLWVDRTLPARDTVALLKALGERCEVGLLAVAVSPPRRPLPPRVSERLDAIRATTDPARKFPLVTRTVEEALGGCLGNGQLLAEEKAPGVEGERQVHAAILRVLTACSCAGVDIEMLEALAASTEEPSPVYLGPLKIRERGRTKVTLPETATTQDLVARLPARAREVTVSWTK